MARRAIVLLIVLLSAGAALGNARAHDAVCAGTSAGPSGSRLETFESGGLTRSYRLYIPPG